MGRIAEEEREKVEKKCKYDLTKTNKYSIFNSGDFIPKSRKYECTNGAQTLVVWAFSNFVENLRITISKKSIIILYWKMDRIIHKTVCAILTNF